MTDLQIQPEREFGFTFQKESKTFFKNPELFRPFLNKMTGVEIKFVIQ